MGYAKPTLKNLFEMEEVITVKKAYRRKYKVNWKQFFINVVNFVSFWKPKEKRPVYRGVIVHNTLKDVIAEMDKSLVEYAAKNSGN